MITETQMEISTALSSFKEYVDNISEIVCKLKYIYNVIEFEWMHIIIIQRLFKLLNHPSYVIFSGTEKWIFGRFYYA